MGQAKARGSFEQRQSVAIAKAEAAAIEKQRLRDERRKAALEAERALPREQRERLRTRRIQVNLLAAMSAGLIAAQGGKA